MRRRAAPRSLLVVREESLAAFVQRIGVLLYDTDWRDEFAHRVSSLEDVRIGSGEEMSALVREQIVAAILVGQVDVRPLFSLIGSPERTVVETDESDKISNEIQQFGRRLRHPAVVEDDTDDNEPVWRIRSSFWVERPEIDWLESKIEIAAQNIFDALTNRSLEDLCVVPPKLAVYLRIYDPDASIRTMIAYRELPEDTWFNRYNAYVAIIARESIGVAWRYAAVNGLTSEENINKKLAEVIREYYQARDLVAPEGTIENIAGKMVKQWRDNDMLGRIFVNSSRDRKRLQGKGTAAKPSRKT